MNFARPEWLILIPMVAGLAVFAVPAKYSMWARILTLLSALAAVLVSVALLAQTGPIAVRVPLGPGAAWMLPLETNGVSTILCLLTAVVYATSTATSWYRIREGVAPFHGLLSLLVAGVFGVFLTEHLLYFFVFYELAVLPMYLLIGIWGSTKAVVGEGPFARLYGEFGVGTRAYGAMKLTIYLLVGSAALLGAIFFLYAAREASVGQGSFLIGELRGLPLTRTEGLVTFALLYFGFGVLAGIWPFHTWSPDGHAAAPPAASMMHAGVLMKLGAFGVMRVGFLALPESAMDSSYIIGTIAVINILYGALGAFWQTDIKYVIAYSSVSHMGVVMLGVATANPAGWNGAVLQMVAHGLMTALFFALVGVIYDETHEREIRKLRGLGKRMPVVAGAWTLAALSSLGLPGLGGFVAELHTMVGAWRVEPMWAIAGAFGAWLTAVYLLRVTRAMVIRGEPAGQAESHAHDLHGMEWVTPLVLGGSLLLIGLWPRLLLTTLEPQISSWLELLQVGVR